MARSNPNSDGDSDQEDIVPQTPQNRRPARLRRSTLPKDFDKDVFVDDEETQEDTLLPTEKQKLDNRQAAINARLREGPPLSDVEVFDLGAFFQRSDIFKASNGADSVTIELPDENGAIKATTVTLAYWTGDLTLESYEILKERLSLQSDELENAFKRVRDLEALTESNGNTSEVLKYKDQAEKWYRHAKQVESDLRRAEKQVDTYVVTAEESQASQAIAETSESKLRDRVEHLERQLRKATTSGKQPAVVTFSSSTHRGRQSSRSRSLERRTAKADEANANARGAIEVPLPKRRASRDGTPATVETGASQLTNYDGRLKVNFDTNRSVLLPELFTNLKDDDSPSYSRWLRQVETKLNASSFRTVADSLSFVHSRTGGSVWEMLESRVPSALGNNSETPTSLHFLTLEELFTWMNETYAEVNRAGKAQSDITHLKQKDGEKFAEFHRKYLLLRAYLVWSPLTEIYELKSKLNKRFRANILGQLFATLAELVRKCELFDISLEDFDRDFPKAKLPFTTDNSNRKRAPKSASAATSVSTTVTVKPPLAKLTDADREKLKAENRCFRCREVGHRPADKACKLRPQANSARVEELSDSDDDQQGNGKSAASARK
ncbi:unnamed protein product [Zymoseptoria tritici ST99CH_1A5]|uniref:CCHC-type domain-containing protein n=1 Tax=Zymoseptoria tritici ST99CH_1A5 TaxID=1276529 RepID=A0A1Y6LWY3_ZYMTR|nr:unnamed protein product [Zymoseptoria tritici ST99CH_1A5]